LPVAKADLVLEVGSGGNPYFRSNVLSDPYFETSERHWAPLIADRSMVLAFAEHLPFKDKSFDFIIASHVLEHSFDPEAFLQEMQRVARAGYIEVPNAFFDRICPYDDHRLEIRESDGKLIIRKKKSQITDPDFLKICSDTIGPLLTEKIIKKFPFAFHVRYYWDAVIEFAIVNPEDHAFAAAPRERKISESEWQSGKARFRESLISLMRRIVSQKKRNQKIDIIALLECPKCKSDLQRDEHGVVCKACGNRVPVRDGYLAFS